MKQATTIFTLSLFLYFVFALHTAYSQIDADQKKHQLRLLITSDMHGWLSNQLIHPDRKPAGLHYLADYMKQVRTKAPETILIDAGDILSGSPQSYYYHYLHPKKIPQSPFFKLINALKYDVIIPGNHDLEILNTLINDYIPNSNAKWLAANLFFNEQQPFRPYQLIRQKGFKTAIIGVTTPGFLMWSKPAINGKMDFLDLEETLRKVLEKINRTDKPDFIILAAHIGINSLRDDENAKLNRIPLANNIRELIKYFPQINLIISGHDHFLSPYKTSGRIKYLQNRPVISAGRLAESVTDISFSLQKTSSGWKISKYKTVVFKPTVSLKSSDKIKIFNKDYLSFINKSLGMRIHKTKSKKATECINQLLALAHIDENTMGTVFPLISKITQKKSESDLLTRKHIYRWLRYPNKSVKLLLNQRDLYLLTNPKAEFGSNRISYNRKLYFFSNDEQLTINKKWNWKPFDNEYKRIIPIKISDYHYYGGGGIIPALFVKQKNVIEKSEDIFQEKMIHYIQTNKFQLPGSCDFLEPYKATSESFPK